MVVKEGVFVASSTWQSQRFDQTNGHQTHVLLRHRYQMRFLALNLSLLLFG